MEKPPVKKVTIQIPEDLWLRAKRHALDERTNLRALILKGLEAQIPAVPGGIFDWYAMKAQEAREARGEPSPEPSSEKGGKQ